MSPNGPVGRVLVIDDDPGVTETFARMLRLEGYLVDTTLSGEAGFSQATNDRPDVILLDMRMPVMNGERFLERLRQMPLVRQTPVAIITGDYFIDDDTIAHLRELGAVVYFKPVWFEDILAITHELFKRSPAPTPSGGSHRTTV